MKINSEMRKQLSWTRSESHVKTPMELKYGKPQKSNR